MNDLLTVAEVAHTLRLSRLAIYRRIADGSLGAIRLGPPPAGRLRVPAAELERFLKAGVKAPNHEVPGREAEAA